jgi:dipeptidase
MNMGRILNRILILVIIFAFPGWRLFAGNGECFTIIAGKNATDGGCVLMAHNEDDDGKNLFVNTHKIQGKSIPNLKKGSSPGFLWFELMGAEFGDSYINEYGVTIASNQCLSREDKPVLTGGGIGPSLRRILAEQAISARNAVELAGELIQQSGYSSSGRTYVIADSTEGWLLQIVYGKHWIAARVPDDQVAVIANRYTIEKVDFNDKQNFMGSSDIILYAVKRGWYNPKRDGEFNFAKIYSAPDTYNSQFNVLRQWRGTSLLGNKRIRPDNPLPFSFYPRKKLRETDLFKVLRDHYEDTEFDATQSEKVSPNDIKFNTICNETTQYSFVARLRKELPQEFANLVWVSFSHPDSNSFAPWYLSIDSPPDGYSINKTGAAQENNSKYAFHYYSKLSQLVDQKYRSRIKTAKKEWENFEDYAIKTQNNMEKEFDYIVKKNKYIALKHITNYVYKLEYRKWFLASELIGEVSKK